MQHKILYLVCVFLKDGPSVTDTQALLDAPNNESEVHSVTVTCTIDLQSTAEQCEVMAIPHTSGETVTGNNCMCVCACIRACVCGVRVCVCVCVGCT